MKHRLLPGPFIVALLLAGTFLAAGTAQAAPFIDVRLQPSEFKDVGGGERANWAEDTMLMERFPDANFGNGDRLNISGIPGREAWALLTFDVHDWQNPDNETALPPNATFSYGTVSTQNFGSWPSGTLLLTYADTMKQENKGRTLEVLRVNRNWNESTITWQDVQEQTGFYQSDELDVSGSSASPDRISIDTVSNEQRAWYIPEYMQDVFHPETPAELFGLIVRDAQQSDCTTDASCRQIFYSSNHLDTNGEPQGCNGNSLNCHPTLFLQLDLNAPELWNIRYDDVDSRRKGVFVAPHHPINISFRARDPVGTLESVRMHLTDPNGTVMWSEEIFTPDNRTRHIPDVEAGIESSFRMWRNASLDVPPGRYIVNFTAIDSDDRKLHTRFLRTNITVEATPPNTEGVEVFPRRGDEDTTVNMEVTVDDLRGIESVWAEVTDPSGRVFNTTNFTATGNVNEMGNGTYKGSHLFEDPGRFEVRIKALDTSGNVATTDPVIVELNDTTNPRLVDRGILNAPATRANAPAQEIGGSLTFRAVARDNHALGANVTLQLEGPGGASLEVHPAKVSEDTWRTTVEFDDPAETPPGRWTATFHVTDPQGNTPSGSSPVVFMLEEGLPPRLMTHTPTGWANGTPTLVATVDDVNLDPDTLQLYVNVGGQGFDPVAAETRSSNGQAHVEAALGPYFHGEEVRVRLNASDSLGRSSAPTWNFTVDAVDPTSTLTFEGTHREALERHEMPFWTLLSFSGDDEDSGFHHVEARLLPKDAAAPSLDWTRISGPLNVTKTPGYRGNGPYILQYRAVDAVGNREAVQEADILVDSKAPTIQYTRTRDALHITALDAGSGLHGLHVFYRNSSGTFRELPLEVRQRVEGGGEFVADLPFTPRGSKGQVYFTATDRLGNSRFLGAPGVPGSRPITWTEPNHAPEVSLTAPPEGSALTGETTILWQASDPDGDTVNVRVEARPVVLSSWRTIVEPDPGVHRVKWDTRTLPDGAYELRVVATDGTNRSVDSARVEVANTNLGVAGLDMPKGRLDVGERVPLHVTLYRPVKNAEANVYLVTDSGRRLAATVSLEDDGRGADEEAGDGVYSGVFEPEEKGRYEVGLHVLYGDDSRLEEDRVSSFTTESTLVGAMEEHRFTLIVAGVILLALVAVALVQLHRYGYI